MVVICLSDCPPRLRGDLSKWMMEINTGVYVGNVSGRVRDGLWERVCENIKTGHATMVYSAAGEQKMKFRVHNTTWEPVDFEGLTLMRRPLPGKGNQPELPENFSKAARQQIHRRKLAAEHKAEKQRECYVVVDVETTGLSPAKDELIEIGAIRVEHGVVLEEFQCLIRSEQPVPEEITALTGITEAELTGRGILLAEAMERFRVFLSDSRMVCHNAPFDTAFLRAACKRCGQSLIKNTCVDTLPLARKKLRNLQSFQLEHIAKELGVEVVQSHRAIADCHTTMAIYEELKMR